MVNLPKRGLLLLVVSSTLLSSIAYANESNLIKSIMKLRAEVETLYNQIDENKDSYKSQMKSYTMQIADNEAQINRRETSLKLTMQEIKSTQDKIKELAGQTEDLSPMIDNAILQLKKEINAGIPFKVKERISSLDKIQSDFKAKNITQEKALALVWSSYDDTVRMSKEIGHFKQEITLDGEPIMAKVAKIGSVMLFFATPDQRLGYVTKESGKYVYKVTTDEVEKAHIVEFFDALRKQIRTGYFMLPNALILRGVK